MCWQWTYGLAGLSHESTVMFEDVLNHLNNHDHLQLGKPILEELAVVDAWDVVKLIPQHLCAKSNPHVRGSGKGVGRE